MTDNDFENKHLMSLNTAVSNIKIAIYNVHDWAILAAGDKEEQMDSDASLEIIIGRHRNILQEVHGQNKIATESISVALQGPFEFESSLSYINKSGQYEAFRVTRILNVFINGIVLACFSGIYLNKFNAANRLQLIFKLCTRGMRLLFRHCCELFYNNILRMYNFFFSIMFL